MKLKIPLSVFPSSVQYRKEKKMWQNNNKTKTAACCPGFTSDLYNLKKRAIKTTIIHNIYTADTHGTSQPVTGQLYEIKNTTKEISEATIHYQLVYAHHHENGDVMFVQTHDMRTEQRTLVSTVALCAC